jgi:murein DD-endopeptidase MepM/ murein hydrolase activator NlpD
MKKEFTFDHKNLQFNETPKRRRAIIIKYLSFFLLSVVLSIVYITIFTYFFQTPKQKEYQKQKEQILSEYKKLENNQKIVAAYLDAIQTNDNRKYRQVFEMDPIPSDVRRAGAGGNEVKIPVVGLDHIAIVKRTTKSLDQLERQLYMQSKSYDKVEEMAHQKEKMIAAMPAIPPLLSKDYRRISDRFGMRLHPVKHRYIPHKGVDFAGSIGVDIYATGDGVVKLTKVSNRGYGREILIDHGFGYKTRYAHLSKILVKEGDVVSRGTLIGKMGNSGTSTGPHLHYEVIHKNIAKDPLLYVGDISDEELQQVVKSGETQN